MFLAKPFLSGLRIYRKEGQPGLKKTRRGRPKKNKDGLEERIKQLEMENTLLKALAIELGGRIARGARYRAIYRYQKQFNITAACACLGVSRSAYYAWVKRMDIPDPDEERMQLVREAYERSRNTYGYRRIGIWIEKEHGIKINHKAVLRLMRKLRIRSIARKKNPYRQIQNRHGAVHTYPNQMG